MPCYGPLKAWRSRERNESGKRGITFLMSEGYADQQLEVPCGQCIGCRKDKARAWAVRCMHEASLSEFNSFITLTYAPENCPTSLVKRDLQLFFKRLRFYSQRKFRYFAVGEYGEQQERPHYHILLFGYDFPDKKFWKGTNFRQYRSEMLEKCWPLGHALCGSVTTASAQYVSKYIIKRVTGDRAEEHYRGRSPEFSIMSRRPGIGAGWIDKFSKTVFPRDFVVVPGGKRVAVPRYYLDRQKDDRLRKQVKHEREVRNRDNPNNEHWRRLDIEHYEQVRAQQLTRRKLEDEAASLRSLR